MERTNFFFGLILSFFSSKFYREVAKSWRGRSMVALAIFLAIFWIVLVCIGGLFLISHGKSMANEIAQQMPTITIKGGLASTEQQKPTMIYISQSKSPLAIIDTHHQFTNFAQSNAAILVTQKEVIVKQDQNQNRQYQFTEKFDGVFGPDEIRKIAERILFFVAPAVLGLIAILAFTMSYALVLFFTLIVALIGWLVAILMSREVNYWGIYHLTLLAWLPTIIVSFILVLISAFSWWALLGVLAIYTFFGICVQPREE